MRSDGLSLVRTFSRVHINKPYWTVTILTAVAVKSPIKLEWDTGICASWRQFYLEKTDSGLCDWTRGLTWLSSCLSFAQELRESSCLALFHCLLALVVNTSIVILDGTAQTTKSRTEPPKRKILSKITKIMSERGNCSNFHICRIVRLQFLNLWVLYGLCSDINIYGNSIHFTKKSTILDV